MRAVMLALVACASGAFGLSNLAFDIDTLDQDGEGTLTANLEHPGDTVEFTIALDVDGNGAYEEGTDLVLYSTARDGMHIVDGDDQMDTAADGLLSLHFTREQEGPLSIPGAQVWVLDDGAGPDTTTIVIKSPDPTDTYVKGTVTGPDGAPVANIWAQAQVCTTTSDRCPKVTALTDANGEYVIYLDPSMRGHPVDVSARDEFSVLTAAIAPAAQTFDLVDSLTDVDIQFSQASQFVKATVLDDAGAPVAGAYLRLRESDGNAETNAMSDSNGVAVIPTSPGTWRLEYENRSAVSEYLTPQVDVVIASDDDTVEVTYTIYYCDDSITGRVIDDSSVADFDNVYVGVSTTIGGSDVEGYVRCGSSGEFNVPVSSTSASYMLRLHYNGSLANGYIILPPEIDSLAPGDTGAEFRITLPNQFAVITVEDENGDPVQVSLSLDSRNSNMSSQLSTDSLGVCTGAVIPGEWGVRIEDPTFLVPSMSFTVADSAETTLVTCRVYRADDSLTGTVIAQEQGFDFGANVCISAHGYVAADSVWLSASALINTDGSYVIRVHSGAEDYNVDAELDSAIQTEYALSPPYYPQVMPGDTALNFEILPVEVTVFCNVDITLDNVSSVELILVDTVNNRTFRASASMPNPDVFLGVPAGTYNATMTVCYNNGDPCHSESADGVVLSEGVDVTVYLNDNGLSVPPAAALPRARQPLVFGLKCLNTASTGITLQFSTPAAGRATLELFDMKGRLAARMFSADVKPGVYAANVQSSGALGRGAYLARLSIRGTKAYAANLLVVKTR